MSILFLILYKLDCSLCMLCSEVCKHSRRISTLHLKASRQKFILHWQKFNEPNLIFARKLDENRFEFGGKKDRTGDEGKESALIANLTTYIYYMLYVISWGGTLLKLIKRNRRAFI